MSLHLAAAVRAGTIYSLLLGLATAQLKQGAVDLYLNNSRLDPQMGRQDINTAYFGVFEAGTPAQEFTGCFDTGSADAWLPLTSCQSLSCQSHTSYSPNASTSYQSSNVAFSIQYATASVAGNLAYETINLGGIVIPKQAIGMVKTAGSGLQESSCDGIFGFGFQSLSQLKSPAPFFSMVQDQLLAQNTFSFWFSQVSDEEPAGELYLGGVNPAKFSGDISYMTVPNDTYWSVPLGGAVVAATSVGLMATVAILDTSSTAISVSVADGVAIHQEIPGAVYWQAAGLYNISGGCSKIASQPTVSFKLGSNTFAIPPSLWVIQYQGACVSGFVPVGSSNQLVLGVPFLRAWHSQFSYNPTTKEAIVGLAVPTATVSNPAETTLGGSVAFAGRKLKESSPDAGAMGTSSSSVFAALIPTPQQRGLP